MGIRAVSIAGTLCLLVAMGCARTEVAQAPTAEDERRATIVADPLPPRVQAFAWDCDDGSSVVSQVDADTDELWLFLPTETVNLAHLPAASGAKYGSEEVSFWNKGEEAMLETDEISRKCSVNRFRSNIESIKLSGGDFWAVGNEPGWSLEIYSDWLVLTTGYGEQRHEVMITGRSEDRAAQPYVFRGMAGDESLVVELRAGPCFDSMSGEEFETAVEIDLGEQHLIGCGTGLH